MRAKPLIETSLLIALTVVLFLGSFYIPLLGIAISFFSPVPLVVLSMRYGLRRGIGGSLIASFFILLIAGPFQAFLFLFNSAAVAIAVGYLVGKGFKASEVIFYGTLVSLGAKITFFGLSALLMGINPFEMNLKFMQDAVKSSIGIYEKLGVSGEELSTLKKNLGEMIGYLRIVFPAVIIVASAFDTFLTFIVSGWVLRKSGENFPSLPPLSEWRFPRSVFWGLVAGIGFSLVGGYLSNPYLAHAGANLQLVFGFLFIIQGLSVIDFLMKRFNFPRAIRALLIVIFFIQPILSRIAMFIGMFDILVDLRRRRRG
ncbi:MAG: YybS family protein [Synergistetes bacterium]|nr:YybS family protein [Synergistota bacterium]